VSLTRPELAFVPASPQGEAKKGICRMFGGMGWFCSPRPFGGEAAEQRDAGEGVAIPKCMKRERLLKISSQLPRSD
jgi:hypothetical protein